MFAFLPDAPGRPEVTDVTRSTVSLIWSAPVYDGGSKVVGYIIERKPVSEVGDGRWLKCNYTIVSDNFFTVTALSEGDTYEFRVLAKNAAGVISKGSESTGPITCRDEYGKNNNFFWLFFWGFFFRIYIFIFYFIFKLYIIVLVLPNNNPRSPFKLSQFL